MEASDIWDAHEMRDAVPSSNFWKVVDFHKEVVGVEFPDTPGLISEERKALRIKLMTEELLEELIPAIERDDMVEIADGLADTLVVVYGTAAEYGIDIDMVFDVVHETNMAKKDGPVREDGKKLKPEGWQPPDIEKALWNQGWKVGASEAT